MQYDEKTKHWMQAHSNKLIQRVITPHHHYLYIHPSSSLSSHKFIIIIRSFNNFNNQHQLKVKILTTRALHGRNMVCLCFVAKINIQSGFCVFWAKQGFEEVQNHHDLQIWSITMIRPFECIIWICYFVLPHDRALRKFITVTSSNNSAQTFPWPLKIVCSSLERSCGIGFFGLCDSDNIKFWD